MESDMKHRFVILFTTLLSLFSPSAPASKSTSTCSGSEKSACPKRAVLDKWVPNVLSDIVLEYAKTPVSIAPGFGRSLVLFDEGSVIGFGSGAYGEPGEGSTVNQGTPFAVSLLGKRAQAMAVGYYHTLMLLDDGMVLAFGANNQGQLGDGTYVARSTPAPVNLDGRKAQAIAAGYDHSLVLLDGGTVVAFGQLGRGSETKRATPAAVNLAGVTARAIAAGAFHSLVLLDGGAVVAFGRNDFWQLGDGSKTGRATPAAVNLGGRAARAIAAGGYHSLVLLDDGTVMAFGYNGSGQLGDGGTINQSASVSINLEGRTARAIAAARWHSLVLLDDGAVMAFGRNTFGQLGDGSITSRSTPVPVALGGRSAQAIAAGDSHSFALLNDGTVLAFGYNRVGQLGDGSTTDRSTPVPVNFAVKAPDTIPVVKGEG
jgi:alpha-tubulin suppressor-like RCC1 family protein